MKKFLFLLFLILFTGLGIALIPSSKAQDASCDMSNVESACSGTNGFSSSCNDLLTRCESSISQALQDSINATAPLQSRLDSLNSQIQGIKDTVTKIENSLTVKKQNIDQGYANLAKQQEILDATIRDYYIKSYYNSPLVIFLSSATASQFTQILGYQRANADRDKAIIENIALTIQDLETQKAELKTQEAQLTSLKTTLDQQTAQLNTIVSGAKAYQATLSNQLASLNSIQQSIIAAKLAGLNIPLTAYAGLGGGCSSDISPYKDPGFSGTKFGFFTYGVPNRVGLNQYGALGRAQAGQSYQDILNAYYQNIQFTNIDPNTQITVNGTNDYGESFNNQQMSIEDYVKHLYEMPSAWPAQALEAQAIAARSYAMAATNNGASAICPNQHCQEVKTEINAQSWQDAVDATKGIIMTNGGSPIKAWYSSTHGGYEFSSSDIGWSSTPYTKEMQDTASTANSFSDLSSNAYDGPSHANSPWFYCDWGSRSQYNGTAWLQSSEVADIVNAILLAQKDSSTVNHLYQTDKPNPAGTDTWSADQVRQELQNRGITPFNSISNISVSANFGSGNVTNVSVTGDAGTVNINGSDFKNYFDLRAPANIQIVGPMYNIEQR